MKKIISLLFLTKIFIWGAEAQTMLNIGDKAPVFKAIDENGKTWDAGNVIGKEYLVVYFYPAAMTGGCTQQACSYRDFKDEFSKIGATVVGISGDEPGNLAYFRKANNLNFTLLSDTKGEVAKMFGVTTSGGGTIEREIDGKTIGLTRGITAKRWTFIIDREGKILSIDNNVNASEDTNNTLQKIREAINQK